jgi:hypothetical protein
MMTCKDASKLLSAAQDRRLGPGEWLRLKVHLLICRGCANFSNQLALMRAAIRRHRDEG